MPVHNCTYKHVCNNCPLCLQTYLWTIKQETPLHHNCTYKHICNNCPLYLQTYLWTIKQVTPLPVDVPVNNCPVHSHRVEVLYFHQNNWLYAHKFGGERCVEGYAMLFVIWYLLVFVSSLLKVDTFWSVAFFFCMGQKFRRNYFASLWLYERWTFCGSVWFVTIWCICTQK